LGKALEANFLFDTGATRTLISGSIARHLDLPLEGEPIRAQVAGGKFTYLVPTTVNICIRSTWHKVPACVPWPVSDSDRSCNLLGMEGLLDHYMFCLTRDELYVFERRA
jgi:hypothetical protein